MSEAKEIKAHLKQEKTQAVPFFATPHFKKWPPDAIVVSERSKIAWHKGNPDQGYVCLAREVVAEDKSTTLVIELFAAFNEDDGKPRQDNTGGAFEELDKDGKPQPFFVVSPVAAGQQGVGFIHLRASDILGLLGIAKLGFGVYRKENGSMEVVNRSGSQNTSDEKLIRSIQYDDEFLLANWFFNDEYVSEEEQRLEFLLRRSVPVSMMSIIVPALFEQLQKDPLKEETRQENRKLTDDFKNTRYEMEWLTLTRAQKNQKIVRTIIVAAGGGDLALVQKAFNLAQSRNLQLLLDPKNDQGHTALMLAAKNGHTGVVMALIAAGASLTVTDNEGRNALNDPYNLRQVLVKVLHAAAAQDNLAEVERLLKLDPVLVRFPDAAGNTVLHVAVLANNADLVNILFTKYNANPLVVNNSGTLAGKIQSRCGNKAAKDVESWIVQAVKDAAKHDAKESDPSGRLEIYFDGLGEEEIFVVINSLVKNYPELLQCKDAQDNSVLLDLCVKYTVPLIENSEADDQYMGWIDRIIRKVVPDGYMLDQQISTGQWLITRIREHLSAATAVGQEDRLEHAINLTNTFPQIMFSAEDFDHYYLSSFEGQERIDELRFILDKLKDGFIRSQLIKLHSEELTQDSKPISFATSRNSFLAEGRRYEESKAGLTLPRGKLDNEEDEGDDSERSTYEERTTSQSSSDGQCLIL